MSSQPHEVRVITDRLDSVGNVTKAASKGYAVGGSALSCFVLFQAFMDEISAFSGTAFEVVNMAKVEVVCGGLIGMMMIFLFSGWSMQSVGATAQKVVHEVRRQFKSRPGIMDGSEQPDHETCVAIVTRAALKEMVWPAMLALITPVCVGFGFKWIGAITGRPQLGVEVTHNSHTQNTQRPHTTTTTTHTLAFLSYVLFLFLSLLLGDCRLHDDGHTRGPADGDILR